MRAPSPISLVLLGSVVINAFLVVVLTVSHFGRSSVDDAAAAVARPTGAKAYARVVATGSGGVLDAERSRNIRSISSPSTGVVCFDVKVSVKNVVATVNAASAVRLAEAGLVAPSIDGTFGCPSEADVVVRTFDIAGNLAIAPFYIVMH